MTFYCDLRWWNRPTVIGSISVSYSAVFGTVECHKLVWITLTAASVWVINHAISALQAPLCCPVGCSNHTDQASCRPPRVFLKVNSCFFYSSKYYWKLIQFSNNMSFNSVFHISLSLLPLEHIMFKGSFHVLPQSEQRLLCLFTLTSTANIFIFLAIGGLSTQTVKFKHVFFC